MTKSSLQLEPASMSKSVNSSLILSQHGTSTSHWDVYVALYRGYPVELNDPLIAYTVVEDWMVSAMATVVSSDLVTTTLSGK